MIWLFLILLLIGLAFIKIADEDELAKFLGKLFRGAWWIIQAAFLVIVIWIFFASAF